MSSFVVFSCLGFYPVTPGNPLYEIGSPQFEKATIKMENGNEFKVIAKNRTSDNKYIQTAKLNGKDLKRCKLSHDDVLNGGVLELEMGNKPNYSWGVK
jgi:putative alpha-1,2-mannosidase